MKILSTLFLLSSFTIVAFAQEKSNLEGCKNICKVSRIKEEGVLLGVRINNVPNSNQYAAIQELLPKTSAEKAGLQVGNIIQAVDDVVITSKGHLVTVIQSHKAGDKVNIRYQAGEKIIIQKIRLGAKTTFIVEEMECCDEIKNTEEVAVSEGLNVFPNPASSEITIATKEALEGDAHILIYSVEGKEKFYDKQNRNESLKLKVNVSDYPSGTYFVRIETAKANYFQKFEVIR